MLGGEEIIREAERCVKCAYCLPHCPTYRLLERETDSPRGRIELIRRVAEGGLAPTEAARYLDPCLSCRACERCCPSKVDYGALIAAARVRQRDALSPGRRLAADQLRRLLAKLPYSPLAPWLSRIGWPLAKGLAASAAPRHARLFRRPPRPGVWRNRYPAKQPNGARVALFTGCVARLSEGETVSAAITVLNHLGYEVLIPDKQSCCGAMDRHAGDSEAEARLGQNNRRVFSLPDTEAMLFLASGCGQQLLESAPPLTIPVREVCDFVVASTHFKQLAPRPLKARAALHTPCSHRNLPEADAPLRMLTAIPRLETRPLDEDGLCCGGAGLYLLTQPTLSDRLAENKRRQMIDDGADLLLTTNTGCALQLSGSLADGAPRVVHPIVLLAEQLDTENTQRGPT